MEHSAGTRRAATAGRSQIEEKAVSCTGICRGLETERTIAEAQWSNSCSLLTYALQKRYKQCRPHSNCQCFMTCSTIPGPHEHGKRFRTRTMKGCAGKVKSDCPLPVRVAAPTSMAPVGLQGSAAQRPDHELEPGQPKTLIRARTYCCIACVVVVGTQQSKRRGTLPDHERSACASCHTLRRQSASTGTLYTDLAHHRLR